MRVLEQIGKTVEEAKAQALEKLGVKSEEEVDIEILDEGSKGVFGWGTKYARIRVKVKDVMAEELETKIKEILNFMQADAQLEKISDDGFSQAYNIYGEELGFIIGKKGQTLEALQLLINIIANKNREDRIKIVIDVEGYRQRREKYLKDIAQRTAFRVKREKKIIVLEPMLSSERKIIHLALKDSPDVTTYSEGQDPLRKVVIAPRRGAPSASSRGEDRKDDRSEDRSGDRGGARSGVRSGVRRENEGRRGRAPFKEKAAFIPRKEGPLPPPPLPQERKEGQLPLEDSAAFSDKKVEAQPPLEESVTFSNKREGPLPPPPLPDEKAEKTPQEPEENQE